MIVDHLLIVVLLTDHEYKNTLQNCIIYSLHVP